MSGAKKKRKANVDLTLCDMYGCACDAPTVYVPDSVRDAINISGGVSERDQRATVSEKRRAAERFAYSKCADAPEMSIASQRKHR